MVPEAEVIRSEAGVTLTRLILRSGGFPVDTSFVVQARRFKEEFRSESLAAAEAHFNLRVQEAQRLSAMRRRSMFSLPKLTSRAAVRT